MIALTPKSAKWSPTGKPVTPSSAPAGRNPEREPAAKTRARAEGSSRLTTAIISLTLLLFYFGAAQRVFSAEALRPFASFNARVELDIEDGEVEVWASFALGAGSNPLDLSAETVTLQVKGGTAAYAVTIPAGSFKKDRSGGFSFQGTIDRVKLETAIRPTRDGAFDFEIQTEGANIKGAANPVMVNLTIGDRGGSRTVRAKIE